MSVTEIARLTATEGREDALAGALPGALSHIGGADACTGATAHRCVERPDEFVLVIGWASVADHEAFRETEAFARYRAALDGLLGETPTFAHYEALSG